MNKNIAIGTTTFVLVYVVGALLVHAGIDLAVIKMAFVGQIFTFLIAVPLALLAARRIGRVTHLSILVASATIGLGTLWAVVFILNAIAQPAGGHVGWSSLFNSMNLRNTVISTAATLLVPQIWLWLLNRLAANYSFKPRPLRGSA